MDIGSGKGCPSSSLSNFAPHKFAIIGVEYNCMEGFLQSLKFKDFEMQKEVCKLVGKRAKFKGKNKKWWKEQILYWNGIEYNRDSKEYQELLDRAYEELGKNEKFKRALLYTGDATLSHSIGKIKQNETILTRQEFCSRLHKLREKFKEERGDLF